MAQLCSSGEEIDLDGPEECSALFESSDDTGCSLHQTCLNALERACCTPRRCINVVLGSPAADGIHTRGDATLRNITWEDIGEDALTIKGEGTVTLDGGSAVNSADKVFQINAASTFRVSNFRARTAGKFMRQNGGTTFTVHLYIDRCDISDMSESVARTDSSSSTVSMTNTRYSDIGDTNFIGFGGRITESNNTEY